MKDALLSVNDLTVYYYTLEGVIKAVRNVSFQINKGESVCLVGESGSGKSTIGLAVAMSLPQNARIVSGKIIYNNVNLLDLNEEERRKYRGKEISIIFQDPAAALNPLFNIGEQISDVIMYHLNIKKHEAIEQAKNILKRVGLPDPERIIKLYPHELSGGMLQRVSIAIALSTNPKILIADEPTTMLDVTLQAQILELLSKLRDEFNLSMLFITHNLGVAAEICEKIIVMYAGMIVEEGPVDEVLLNPLHPYTKKLLESVPRAQIKVKKLKHIPGTIPDLRFIPHGCPFAERCDERMEICTKEIPKSININPGHRVACIKYYPKGEDNE